jgi:protein subunit release factor A
VRCSHRPSGAVGIARDERSQLQNKRAAFERCTGSDKFAFWAKMELARRECAAGNGPSIKQQVEAEMAPQNIATHVRDGRGKWVEPVGKLVD